MSVISVFHDRAAHVVGSVGSILTQTYPNLEVIVVDDGSGDDTAEQLRAIDDPRLHVISQPNRGFVASIIAAVEASQGSIVAVHGSGDLSLPDRIARQAAVLDARPEVGVVGCWVENDDHGVQQTRLYKSPAGLPFHRTLLHRNLFTHGEVMFRRDVYDQVGGYRDFFRLAQDRDLWLRMSRLTDYAIVPDVLYRRLKPSGGISADPDKLVLQAYLSDFAIQCALVVDGGGVDPIEQHGHLAAFSRGRSTGLALKLAWLGARLMTQGDVVRGWKIIERARHERLTRRVAMIVALGAMHRYPLLWHRFACPVLARRLRSFRQ